jgi:hypothetical protein
MGNTANLGLFAVHKINLQIHGKNLYVHEEGAKRHKSEDISVNDGST